MPQCQGFVPQSGLRKLEEMDTFSIITFICLHTNTEKRLWKCNILHNAALRLAGDN